eukprot:s5629_g1.t3
MALSPALRSSIRFTSREARSVARSPCAPCKTSTALSMSLCIQRRPSSCKSVADTHKLAVRLISSSCCHWRDSLSDLRALRKTTSSIMRLKRTGDWEQALYLLFASSHVLPDIVAFTATVGVCAQASAWKSALTLLERLHSRATPDRGFWNAVGAACSAAGKWQLALWLLLDAPRSASLSPNMVALSAAMTACERVSSWQKVLELLSDAQQRGLAGAHAYSTAIVACGTVFAWQRALLLWSECQRQRWTVESNVIVLNSTLTALERSTEWSRCLHLLRSDGNRENGDGADGISYSAVIAACCKNQEWALSISLLDEALSLKLTPSPGAFSCLARALGHSRAWQQALQLLQLPMPPHSVLDLWSSVAWALDVAGTSSLGLPSLEMEALGRKQFALLDFVQRRARRGDLEKVLCEMLKFARRREWLKIAGGNKSRLLEAILRPGDVVLEFGCFVGFSALLAARRLRILGGGGRVISCELNLVSAHIARRIIKWAGAEAEVEVKIGFASDWIATGLLASPDVVVLDHSGARYHEDLLALEPLRSSARILADNVLSPGAPLLLSVIDGRYHVAVHEVTEFLRRSRMDWVLVSVPFDPLPSWSGRGNAAPPEFQQLAVEINRLCWRSSSASRSQRVRGEEWMRLQDCRSLPARLRDRLEALQHLSKARAGQQRSPVSLSPTQPCQSPIRSYKIFNTKARSVSPPRHQHSITLATGKPLVSQQCRPLGRTHQEPTRALSGSPRAVSTPVVATPPLLRVAAAAAGAARHQATPHFQQLDDARHRAQVDFCISSSRASSLVFGWYLGRTEKVFPRSPCNSVEDHSAPGAVKLTTSGSHVELDILAAQPRRSSEDTPPQIALDAMAHPVGDQEATPTFNLASALAETSRGGSLSPSKGRTKLHMAGELCNAAIEGDIAELKSLLEAGYDVDAGDYDRRAAIHIAAAEGRDEVVAFLLSHKADMAVVDRWGHTPLDEALRAGHSKVAALLKPADAQTREITSGNFERQTSDMETAAMLCAAAATGWLPQIEKLLKSGANPSAADYDGRTALHIAAARGHAEVVSMLLRAKANPTAHDSFGKTPVDEAFQHNDAAVIRALGAAGTNILDEAAGQKNTDFEALKTMAAFEHWSIVASEVQFGKCLSTTIKSAVYLATWRGLKVVAKTVKDVRASGLNPRRAQEASDSTVQIARDELLHEIRTLSTLRHPDLVLFLGASLDTETCFFLTEYMEGGDVETYMRSNRIKASNKEFKPPYHVALSWFLSTARALAFLHGCARPIIHRDLKPLNLLLTKGLDLKVTDFGLSKIMRPKLLDLSGRDTSPAPMMSGGTAFVYEFGFVTPLITINTSLTME